MKNKSTSKMLIFFIFFNCTVVEILAGWATVQSFIVAKETMAFAPDMSALTALIGAVVGEALSYAVYALKSMKENTAGGITYEMAMLDRQEENEQI